MKSTRLPKENVNRQNIDQRVNSFILGIIFISTIMVDSLLTILFLNLDYFILAVLSFCKTSIMVICLVLLSRKKYFLSLQIGLFIISEGAVVFSIFLGWTSYFSMYLIASVFIVINATLINLKLKIFELIIILSAFFLLWITTKEGFYIYKVNRDILDFMGDFNLLTILILTIVIMFQNFLKRENLKKQLALMSEIDTLTGTYNRRFFNNYLDIESRRHKGQLKYKTNTDDNFGIALIDVDNFKKINDTYGHPFGDTVLKGLGFIIKNVLFERDILCRYGGEEFVVLFTSTSKPGALKAIEKILNSVRNNSYYYDDETPAVHVSVSIGYATIEEESDVHKLLDLADKRLYIAKRTGKDRAVSG